MINSKQHLNDQAPTKSLFNPIQILMDYYKDKQEANIILDNVPAILNDNIPEGEEDERINNPDDLKKFILVVMKHLEDFFGKEAKEVLGVDISMPTIIFYDSNTTKSGCGKAHKKMGPFYCSEDESIYINMAELLKIIHTTGMKGDLAITYIISHEWGHHFQKKIYENFDAFISFLGEKNNKIYDKRILGEIIKQGFFKSAGGSEIKNILSVYIELWADYFSGVSIKNIANQGDLHIGDIEEAINSAYAVGDDNISRLHGIYRHPKDYQHGSSQDRVNALMSGIDQGTIHNSPMKDLIFDKYSKNRYPKNYQEEFWNNFSAMFKDVFQFVEKS